MLSSQSKIKFVARNLTNRPVKLDIRRDGNVFNKINIVNPGRFMEFDSDHSSNDREIFITKITGDGATSNNTSNSSFSIKIHPHEQVKEVFNDTVWVCTRQFNMDHYQKCLYKCNGCGEYTFSSKKCRDCDNPFYFCTVCMKTKMHNNYHRFTCPSFGTTSNNSHGSLFSGGTPRHGSSLFGGEGLSSSRGGLFGGLTGSGLWFIRWLNKL